MSLWAPKCPSCGHGMEDGLRFIGRAPPANVFRGEVVVDCSSCKVTTKLGPATVWVASRAPEAKEP